MKLASKLVTEKRFQVFKVSVCGNQTRWGYEGGLTHEEARDLERYPGGVLVEPDGRKFTWGYSVMPRFQ